MARSIQKKIKFTKGMITKSLRERNDIPMYDSSAEEIINYVCTPYGGFRTRRGTRRIDKFEITDRYNFVLLEDSTDGSLTNGLYQSGSLTNIQDAENLVIFDLEEERAEVNLYINNAYLEYEEPKIDATFKYTNTRFESIIDGLSIINSGKGFNGNFSIVGQVLSGTTSITPVINSLGVLEDLSFNSAIYKYKPEDQMLGIYADLPQCKIGISVSSDKENWSEEKLYSLTTLRLDIKEKATNIRYVRIRYYGNSLNTRMIFGDIFTKYELIKLVPFVYNVRQRNLIAISEKKIFIYENRKLKETVDIDEELYFKDIRSVKFSQNEDVIVFTEGYVYPRELRRTAEGWKFQKLPIENIPFHVFGEPIKTKKTIGITPNYDSGAVTITADSAVFNADSVGQQIDGNGGRMRITQFITDKKVSGFMMIPFFNTEKIIDWTYITGYEPVWSDDRGYPITCLYYQQRLWFGGSSQRPSTIWSSRLGIYNDFKNAGNYDNDAINQDMNTSNQIVNLLSNRGLQIFTSGDEWIATEDSLTPNSFSAIKNTANGSDITLTPKNLGGVTLFVEKNGRSLLSYVYDYNQAAYKTSNIGILASLIDKPVDMDIDDNSSLDEGDYLYIVLSDGRMIITTIDFEQEINAPSIMQINGQIVSICNLINETYLLTNHGDGVYLELIDDNVLSDFTIDKYVEQKIDDLEEYEGQYVDVYKDGYRYGKLQVMNGSVTLPYPVNENCSIGLSFSSYILSNDININGRSTSVKKRISKGVVTTSENSKALSFCGIDKNSTDGTFDFFSPTSYSNRLKFSIASEFDKINVYSVMLYLNYGVG